MRDKGETKNIPSINKPIFRRNPHKMLMSILLHILQTRLPHFQALGEERFARGVGVALGEEGGVVGSEGFFDAGEG